jgi:hypothetical protein
MEKHKEIIKQLVFVLDEKCKRGDLFPSWEGFENGNGEECGKDIEELIEKAKEYLKHDGKTNCRNCGEVVEMVSSGEFCPMCFC